MDYMEISGVRFWGADKGKVLREEVGKITYPPDSILHLLRHFSQVPQEWVGAMVRSGLCTLEIIEEQLDMPGSKWNPRTNILTPEHAILFSQKLFFGALDDGIELRWIGRGDMDFCYFPHQVSREEKKTLLDCGDIAMGVQGLISLKEIPGAVKVRPRFNRGGTINIVHMEPRETDQVAVTLARKNTGVIQVYSVFPGNLTPPIPRENQKPEQLEYNRTFWAGYALIE